MNNNWTGYPHLDRPWTKFYKNTLEVNDLENNITYYLKNKTRWLENNIATIYYGNQSSYANFWNDVDNASKVFVKLGIKARDKVLNLVSNIPEVGHLFLGAAQVGIVSDYVDNRLFLNGDNSKKLLDLIDFEKIKYIVVLEQYYLDIIKPIEKQLKERGIDKIITLSMFDSMNIQGRISYLFDTCIYNKNRQDSKNNEQLKFYQVLLNSIKENKDFNILYDDAVKSSLLNVYKYSDLLKDISSIEYENYYEKNQTIYIAHTSGTSGFNPKPIALSNDNLIFSVQELYKMGRFYKPNDKILHNLPYFSSFGLSNNFLLNIASGASSIEVLDFLNNEVGYLIKKYEPTAFLSSPSNLVSLMKYKDLDCMDLSFLKRIVYCGESMTKMDEMRLNNWLRIHNCNSDIEKGYEIGECCGYGSYSFGDFNEYNSIGIPLPSTIYSIVDPNINDSLIPLKFDDNKSRLEGELAISSNSLTCGKLNGEVIVNHYDLDGNDYVRTNDIVEMDRDGLFYFKSRKDRLFSCYDGYCVNPDVIEKAIEGNHFVKYCCIVPCYDESVLGFVSKAHIVLEDNLFNFDVKDIIELIIKHQIMNNKSISFRQLPKRIKIRDFLPLTNNNKVDFKTLENEGLDEDDITIVVNDDSMKCEDISVIFPKNKLKVK